MSRYVVKGQRFAAEIAGATGTDPMLLPTLRPAFDEIVETGLGERDISVTRRRIDGRGAPDMNAS